MAQPSAPTSIVLAIKGLYLNPSTFGDNAPNGALTIANNVVIDRPSVVATRRGFDNSFYTLSSDGTKSMYQYNNRMLLNTTDEDLHVDVNSTGVFTTYEGSYPVPDSTNPASRVRALESNKNFYFITANGTYRLDHIAGQPRLAGSPPGLSGVGVTTGITGFLATDTAVAYRVVFGYKDYNQQLILGAPSSRIIVTNTSGTSANADVTFQVPKEVQSFPVGFFFQLYRGNASANLTTDPDDEMALVYEDGCIGSVSITVNDITPDSLKGAALYTNQGQDGILQSNYRPPWATDICTFKQYAFYSNTRNLRNASITLISSGLTNGPDALRAGDTITFAESQFGGTSFSLTGVVGANNGALGWFNVSDTGNPGLDIQVTASNIALVANEYATNTFLTGYYTSSNTDLPGKLRFDRLSLTEDSFTISVSRTTAWEQSTPITAVNDARPNRIYYSKFNQPEAVPIVNYIEVGSANAVIRRVVPLRDGVMVLKDDGVFRISNAAPPFNIQPIDYNVRILADNTAAELDNKVYFLSDQGVVALGDTEAQIMSFVLDRTIIENTSPALFPNLSSVSWGLAYQSDRKYILAMPSSSADTQSTQQYIYNHLTQVWTKWTLQASCGMIFRRDGKMYLGSLMGSAPGSNNSYVYKERKSFTDNDYADNMYSSNCATPGLLDTIIIDAVSLPAGITIQPGWTILQNNGSALARILQVDTIGAATNLILDRAQMWTTDPVQIYVPVYSEIETIQIDCENPGMNKQFNEVVYIFTEQGFTQLTSRISSNTAGVPITDYLTPANRGGWSIDPWGVTPWGGSPATQGKIRRYVPQKVQRAGWLYFNISNAEAFTSFGFSGLEIFFKSTSSRQK